MEGSCHVPFDLNDGVVVLLRSTGDSRVKPSMMPNSLACPMFLCVFVWTARILLMQSALSWCIEAQPGTTSASVSDDFDDDDDDQ